MGVCENLDYMWHLIPGPKTRAEYIPSDVVTSYKISLTQKTSAKKAILWLLSKAPHTITEIADHFEMSTKLVECLLEELIKSGLVKKGQGSPRRYRLNL